MSNGFIVTPFNYSARYPAGYRISGQTGYPANSVSGATLVCSEIRIPEKKGQTKESFPILDLSKALDGHF